MPLYLQAPRPGRTRNWHIRGTYYGVTVNRSAGSPDRRVAAQALAAIKRQIESGAFAEVAGPTWEDAVISYLNAGGDPRFLDRLTRYWGNTKLEAITQARLDECAMDLYPNATAATRNRQVYTPLSAVLKHTGVDMAFRRPKGSRSEPRIHWLRPEQAERLLAACDAANARFGAMCTYMLYTGSRLSEACNLTWADVRLQEATATARDTKNGADRPVHLPPVVVAALAGLEQREGRVFGYRKSGRLYKLLAQAEAASGVQIPEGISFHIFRHTYGAWMTRLGARLDKTGAWKDRQAAAVYEHIDTNEEARKADHLPVRRVK